MNNQKPAIATPVRTRAIIEAYGLNFKKSLGQNFLTDVGFCPLYTSDHADESPR